MSFTPLLYALLASIANVIGAALVISGPKRRPRLLDALLAFSAAFLIGVSCSICPSCVARVVRTRLVVVLDTVGALLAHVLCRLPLAKRFTR